MEVKVNGRDAHAVEFKLDIDKMPIDEYAHLMNSYQSYFDMHEDTMAFQQKYGLWDKSVYGFLEDDKMKVKIGHLVEELTEIQNAYSKQDLPEFVDGLLDLVYVALGTLNLMNMPVRPLWKDIQIRNMAKIRATADNVGKRGSTFDVIKPQGWTGPRTQEIIDHFNPENNKFE